MTDKNLIKEVQHGYVYVPLYEMKIVPYVPTKWEKFFSPIKYYVWRIWDSWPVFFIRMFFLTLFISTCMWMPFIIGQYFHWIGALK